MKKASPGRQKTAPRWVVYSLLGLLVAFAGLAAFQVVSAQSTFSDPTCNPLTDPGGCNTSPPLLLNPPGGAKQTILTDVDFSSGKALGVSGNLNLNTGAQLRTPSALTGIAVNVTSSGNFAIVGNATNASPGAIQANGQGGMPGLWATSQSGNALLAISTTGNAARFEGPVQLYNGAQTATLTVDSQGNLLVNGNPPAGSSATTTSTAAGSAIATINLKTTLFQNNKYRADSISVLYADTSTGVRTWKPLPSANISYEECLLATPWYSSDLKLTNPISNPVSFRVVVGYTPTVVSCPNEDTTAPSAPTVSLTSSWWYSGTVSLSATVTDGDVTAVDYYVDRGAGPVLIGTGTVGPNWTYSSWDSNIITNASTGVSNSCSSFQANGNCLTPTEFPVTAKARDGAGNVSLASGARTIRVTNGQGRSVCSTTTQRILTCATATQQCCTTAVWHDASADHAGTPPAYCIGNSAGWGCGPGGGGGS